MESLASVGFGSTHYRSYNSTEQNWMNSYFKNMPQLENNYADVDDEMASKEKRFESFKDWPDSSPINPTNLADAGFYYTGVGDQVRCFSCDLQLTKWLRGDVPFDEHRKLRPQCKFIVESEREVSGATCVGETATSHTGNAAYRRHEYESQSSQNKQYNQPTIPTFSTFNLPRDPEYLSGYTGISGPEPVLQYPYTDPQIPVSEQSLPYRLSGQSTAHVTSSPGVFVTSQYPTLNHPVLQTPSHFSSSMRPSFGRPADFEPPRAPQPSYASVGREFPGYQESIPPQPSQRQIGRVDIPVQSPVLQHLPNVHVRTEDIHHAASQQDLQNTHKRLSTFIDWPENCPVKPWELATAGFYYLGTGDNVKCYKCKVALRNWEPEDTPWSEHTRWSPTCPLVMEHEMGKHTSFPVEDQEQSAATMYQMMTPNVPPRAHQAISRPTPSEEQQPAQEKSTSGSHEKEQQTWTNRPYEHSAHANDPSNKMQEIPFETQQLEPCAMHFYLENTVGPIPSASTEIPTGPIPSASTEIPTGPIPSTSTGIPTMPGLTQPWAVRNPDVRYVPLNPIQPVNQGSNERFDDRDFVRAMEMGFTREDIDKAIAKQTQRTGRGFETLDELMQALLDTSEGGTSHTSSLSEESSSFSSTSTDPQVTSWSHSNQPMYNQPRLPTVQSFSLEQSEPACKRALKRSNSAPPSSSVVSNPSESAQRELEQTREERLICKICMDAEVGVVFIPCGHISCCPNCASGLDLCPMCRMPIQQVVRTFLS